jgi:hypothetical protein
MLFYHRWEFPLQEYSRTDGYIPWQPLPQIVLVKPWFGRLKWWSVECSHFPNIFPNILPNIYTNIYPNILINIYPKYIAQYFAQYFSQYISQYILQYLIQIHCTMFRKLFFSIYCTIYYPIFSPIYFPIFNPIFCLISKKWHFTCYWVQFFLSLAKLLIKGSAVPADMLLSY